MDLALPEWMDRNVFFLGVTLLIIVVMGAAHNTMVSEEDATSFGMCDVTLHCQGMESGGMCLGIEYRQTRCVEPENASTYRWAEAECGLDAQGICNANPEMTGTAWTSHPNATYQGTRCSDWAAQDDRIDLLTCEQTFNDVTQWSK